MKIRNYLQFFAILLFTAISLASSCTKKPETPPVPVDPPTITIANPTDMLVNLPDTVRPYIQGTVTTEGILTNVSIFVTLGDVRQRIQEYTTFSDPKNFAINFLPNYTLEMTGIRISATDAKNQTTTRDFAFRVTNDSVAPPPPPSAPVVTFTTPTGMIVDFNTVDFENFPRIQGTVTTGGELANVRIFTLTGSGIPPMIEEHTNFTNPKEFQINVQPNYTLNMTGIRVVATDVGNRTTTREFGFEVKDFNMPQDLTPAAGNRLAFPTAEGAGRYTWGGRGGRVLVVNTLADNNSPGSLRWAVNQTGARTVVFDVSGTIVLTSRLNITNDSITIAGQTAPGDGIAIRGHTVVNQANEVIVRYIRFRPGPGLDIDAFEGRQRRNIILDHLSMSWAEDEAASWYNNRYFTMQWCIVAEPLDVGGRGYGGLMGGHSATFHHNLIAHTRSRNPRINGARLSGWNMQLEVADFVNNVIFNNAGPPDGGEGGRYNIRNNYYKPGPASTGSSARNRFLTAYARVDNNSGGQGVFVDYGRFYISGNVMEGNATITDNNWNGGISGAIFLENSTSNRRHIDSVRVTTPFIPEFAINMRTAEAAFEAVLERAGASLKRDAIDTRIINETRTGTATFGNGLLGNSLGSRDWPVLNSLPPAFRTNRGTPNDDGIPDAWKIANKLPLNQNMANRYSLSNVYTNLEMYLNSIVGHIHQ